MSRFTIICFCLFTIFTSSAQDTWRGLIVEPENRCSPYDKKKQYPYPQSVEDAIVVQMGGHVYGPYTGRYFASDKETDIEHIVAASEGHDSGLCSASAETRVQFATDMLNITLAAPKVNRCSSTGKCGLDAAEWMPAKNKCWFANRIVEIKVKYSLSANQAEADALKSVLASCESVEMIFFPKADQSIVDLPTPSSPGALNMYDDNKNGRITCSEARAHGIAPVRRGHAAYIFMNDRDNNGVVCE